MKNKNGALKIMLEILGISVILIGTLCSHYL
jgi:hypothetical protein